MAKAKIPKRVGGVKIPKQARRKANAALDMARGPLVRELAAAAIVAGAAAATRRQRRAPKPKLEPQARQDEEDITVEIDVDRLADTIRNAALSGLQRFMEGFEEGLRELAAETRETSGRGPAKARGRAGRP